MPLSPGSRVGPYEVLSSLGAGGMGEVYRARDTRLSRDVALKVLPARLSESADALARFEREAKAVAALSHPHILSLFDFGTDAGTAYAVTELLEGRTLRERLAEGPLPQRRSIEYATQIASGLAAAHDKGIVHRDLKPENVFVTHDGHVKILDFGLAVQRATTGPDLTSSPTVPRQTDPGTILGTVGYMAPEQVKGLSADHRADLFALGAVLYEMLSGRRAFQKETAAETMTAVLREDPAELAQAGHEVPPALDQVVRRCLEKDPAQRFESARDLAFALQVASGSEMSGPRPAVVAPSRARALWVPLLVAVVACAAGAFVGNRFQRAVAPSLPPMRFTIPARAGVPDVLSLSPDGRTLLFTEVDPIGGFTAPLQSRRLDETAIRTLSGTEGALFPFWSPDSRRIAYFEWNKLLVTDAAGTGSRQVCEISGPASGGAWGTDDAIVFSAGGALYRVAAGGGAPAVLLKAEPGKSVWHAWPSFLPGGRRFLFTTLLPGNGESALRTRVANVSGPFEPKDVLNGAVGARWSKGHVVYGSENGLFARAADEQTLELRGEPVRLAEGLVFNWRSGYLPATGSEAGLLAFRTRRPEDWRFTWIDPLGRRLGSVGETGSWNNFDLSPDGTRIAATWVVPNSGNQALGLIDVPRNVTTRGDAEAAASRISDPTWAPDGRHVAYRSGGKLVMRAANGGQETTLLDALGYPDSFTRDGRFLLYGTAREPYYELFALPLTGTDRQPIPLVTGLSLADEGRFSPNSRWVAYHASAGGSPEVYVVPFPPTGEKWKVSSEGGVQPRWHPKGAELFYLDPPGRLMSVSMPDSDPRRAAAPRVLFETGLEASPAYDQFAVGPDGERFLFRLLDRADQASGSPIHVLVNWMDRR